MAALDISLFDMMAEKLSVAVISDILDSLGWRNQVLQPGVVPAQSDPSQVLVGRAVTLLVGPQSGDIVFAEVDGIVVIPQDVAEETVSGAFQMVAYEDGAREDLRAGHLLSEFWSKYRVL